MSVGNPFNFGNWLHHAGNGASNPGNDLKLGKFNFLTTGSASANSNTTTIANIAEQNPAITGQNESNGSGVIGIYGESDGTTGSIGVAGNATGWGVGGVSTASQLELLENPYPVNVGVFGAGDNVGVYGQCRVAESQQPTNLPPPANIGVYGIGDAVGVEGDNDGTGTGVQGLSIQGVGVVGQSSGSIGTLAPQVDPIAPYIGVYGMGTAQASPYPVNSQYLATGVFGIGDQRGGVFQMTTPVTGDKTFANVQLTPLQRPEQKITVGTFKGDAVAPQLPTDGQPGDILAVDVQLPSGGSDPKGIQLWVCIKQRQNARLGATWARIQFDVVVTTL